MRENSGVDEKGSGRGGLRYCKAYALATLANFPRWKSLAGEADLGAADVAYLWPDFSVTLSPFPWNPVFLVPKSNPEWELFCRNELGFSLPPGIQNAKNQAISQLERG